MTITLHTADETKLRDAAPDMAKALHMLIWVFESQYGEDASSPAITYARNVLKLAGSGP
jgi:hypothetical protein